MEQNSKYMMIISIYFKISLVLFEKISLQTHLSDDITDLTDLTN